MRVGLFIPCYVDQLFPNVGLAAATLLERQGVTVDYPQAQTCCGQPMANSGFPGDARPLAARFLEIFSGYDAVVCPSGSCTAMVREQYRSLLGDTPALRALQAKTFELCEFLHGTLRAQPKGRFPHKVGLLQSCHGLRGLRLGSGSERQVAPFDTPRSLLAGIEGLKLVDPKRADECCGFGGTFAVNQEAMSCAMGRDRLADFESAGAEVIAGPDVSCLMHLGSLAQREGRKVRLMHLAELLLEAEATA